jgi:hypothetical protein
MPSGPYCHDSRSDVVSTPIPSTGIAIPCERVPSVALVV